MAYIYILKNRNNKKLYIGQTIQKIERRLRSYVKGYAHYYINNAIQKYGWDNFEKFVYEVPEDFLDYFEVELIKNLNTLSPNGYNLTTGGNKNKHFSNDLRQKLSLSQKGLHNGSKNNFYGKKHSDEFKNRLSNERIGKNNPFYGMHHSEDFKQKISSIQKGKVLSDVTKRKISELNKGKKRTEETKRMWSDQRKGSNNPNAKKIICIETKELFGSIKETSIKKYLSYTALKKCCKGKQKTSGGYHWMYYEDYLKQQQNIA